jgi:quercetin dioxygenase-like cupin family protein
MHAFKLYTGEDNASHVLEGTPQYVVTLAGTLEFTTRDGETFIIRLGDVLVATDTAGSGHKWRLIDDAPWRRCYVVLKSGAADLFARKE